MVPVQGDAVLLVAKSTTTTATAAALAMVTATHTLHIHVLVSILKLMTGAAGVSHATQIVPDSCRRLEA